MGTMADFRQEVIMNIRGVLTSAKGSCSVHKLESEYRMMMGCDIPYRKLNFDSVEAFLSSVASFECKPGPQGYMVNARLTEKNAHISRLISVQKDVKRSKRSAILRYGKRPAPKQTYHHNQGYRGQYANADRSGNAGPVRRPMAAQPPKRPLPLTNNNVYEKFQPILNNENPNAQQNNQQHDNRRAPITKEPKKDDKQSNVPTETIKPQIPHSVTTNRSMILQQPSSNISPNQLKSESLSAYNPNSSVWAFSSDSSGEENITEKVFKKTGDSLLDLQNFLKINHHPPPDIKILKRQLKFRKQQCYDCKIVAGGHTFSNYPKDFTSADHVTKYTCDKALEELIPLLKSAVPSASLLVSDNNDVLLRVPPMIEQHSNGIWNEQLERLYADKHKEILPTNWLKVIENSPVVSVQQVSKTLHLLTYCKPEDFLQKGKLSADQKNRPHIYMHSTVSIAANKTRACADDETVVTVEVLCVESAGEIWCRLVDTAEAARFNNLSLALTRAYLDARLLSTVRKPDRVITGGHYVVIHGDVACRVQVLGLTQPVEDKALCFYVDYGDAQEVLVGDIYSLDEQFATIQAQAFQCRLQGLEDLYEYSTESELLMNLVGNEYFMEVSPPTDKDTTDDEIMGIYLYDMDTNANINEILENQLIVESAVPYLNDTAITNVVVTNVEDSGDIFVQLRPNKPGFNKLMELQGLFNEAISKNESWIKSMPVISKDTCGDNKIFIAKSNKDNRYYRVIVNDWEPSGRFLQIFFIDLGFTDIIKLSEAVFYDVSQFSEILLDFEGQALRIKLDIEEVPTNFSKVFEEIVGNSSILARMVRLDDENVPIVKLFKRVLPDNLLASINETIVLNYEKRPEKPTKRELLRSKSKYSPSSGELKSPEIPAIGSFFDVNVPNAVSPWNFFIQPWNSNLKLEKLMESLQQRYNKDVQYSPLSMDDIIPGKVYASRHPESGVWHRTSVTKVINPQSISVYYVDYGYYFNLHSNQLMPLGVEFTDLPYQSIKAKLSGVKPTNNKWTMGDCELFRALVTGKQFVSVIEKTETDEFCPYDVVLCLRLVDTRGEQDVHIGDVLIKKDIAVAC